MNSDTSDVNGVIITGDLDRRPSRAPDYHAENQALTALAEAMSTNPGTVLQRLVEVAMELTRSDSAGISLLEPGGESGTIRWVATAGAWSPYRDGTMPHEASPCGEVIAREAVVLMKNPERSFPALSQAEPGISEGLLAPFHLGGVPVGTVWTIKHSPDDHFDAEDARIIKSLARFASAAHQTVQALRLAEAASQHAEIRVQQLVTLAEVSSEFFGTCDMEFMPIYGNAAAMRMVGLADLDEVKRTPLQEFFFPEDLAFITDEFFPRVLREGQAKVEIRFRHFVTGEPVWVDYSLVVLKDEMGRPTGFGTVTHDLTERKRAEAALRVSEARFRQFSDASTTILWIRNAATMRMEFASPAFDTIYGISGPDRGGDDRLRSWARLIVPEDRRQVLTNFQRIRGGERIEQEFRVRRGSDGDVRWIKDVGFPLTDEQGRVQVVAGVGQDVTAQKRAEEALHEREERLGLIVENARGYAIFMVDPAGIITDWREGAEAVFGWSRAEAIGMDAREIFTPEDREAGQFEKEMKGALDQGRAPDVRWHLHKDGSRVFIDGALTRLGEGSVAGFLKIGQDVTERHRAEAALSASEGRLQTLMQGIPQLVWRTCDKGLWTWASPQWLEFTGQIQDNSQGLGWLDVIHPGDHEKTKLSWVDARPNGLLDVEFRVRRAADGAWIWHHTRSVPVRNEQGRIVEWLGTSTDMQMLKEFQERQGVLVGELQHRTRNLIAIVRSTSDKTARASTDLTDFRARFRDRLDALARVQGLLSRLNDLDRVTFDELIKAEMTAMDSDPDKVTLNGPTGIRLRSSTVQTLAMALHELATNAVKYAALGQVDAHLAVTWRWESSGDDGEPWLHIEWRETGVVMAPIGAAPRGTGQGRELIERALPYQLSAKTSYELGRDGVHCTISLPVSATVVPEAAHD